MTSRIVFRTAAGPRIGGGHVYRCLALAQALEDLGAETSFAVNDTAQQMVPALGGDVKSVEQGDGTAFLSDIAGEVDQLLEGAAPDWVVLDHYQRNAEYEESLQARGVKVLAIDDLARNHVADVVVDPAPARLEAEYRAAAPASMRLLGSDYAPLRAQFAEASPELGREGSLVISFGAADPSGETVRVLKALEARPESFEGRRVLALVGSGAPHRRAAIEAAQAIGAEVLSDVRDMVALLSNAGVAIGAGGVGALERCCLGLPSLVLEIADNQRPTIQALVAAGAAQEVPMMAVQDGIPNALAELLQDYPKRVKMAVAARRVCDGKGAARLAEVMLNPIQDKMGRTLVCRPARMEDAKRLFDWQTEPGTRQFARNPEPPKWEEHCAWLARVLENPDQALMVVERADAAVGSVRLDRIADGVFEVSIVIGAPFTGQGVGRAALHALEREARRIFGVAARALHAYVQDENIASQRLFAAAGYQPISGKTGWYQRDLETVL